MILGRLFPLRTSYVSQAHHCRSRKDVIVDEGGGREDGVLPKVCLVEAWAVATPATDLDVAI